MSLILDQNDIVRLDPFLCFMPFGARNLRPAMLILPEGKFKDLLRRGEFLLDFSLWGSLFIGAFSS